MKRNRIFRIAFCLMGIVCLFTGIRMMISGPATYMKQQAQAAWPRINAEITDVSSRVESSGTRKHHRSTTYYDFTIQYEVDGKVYTNESRRHTRLRLVGDSIPIKYNPAAPEDFTTTLSPSISEMLILMLFGAIFATLGFFLSGAYALIRRWRRRGMPEEEEELPPEEYVAPGTGEQVPKFSAFRLLLRLLIPVIFVAVSIRFFPGTDAVDPEQFQRAAESRGYATMDTTEQLRQDWRVGSMLEEAVSVDDGTLRIDFCVLDTVPSAQQLYHGMNLPVTDGAVTDNGGTLHELYAAETDRVYVAKIRMTNTVIYLWTPLEQKETVADLLDSIGYWKGSEN